MSWLILLLVIGRFFCANNLANARVVPPVLSIKVLTSGICSSNSIILVAIAFFIGESIMFSQIFALGIAPPFTCTARLFFF